MAMPMRAKLKITSVARTLYGGDLVEFTADYSNTPEDNSFAEATPDASAKFRINNPALVGAFNPGDTFYVDFTPVDGG